MKRVVKVTPLIVVLVSACAFGLIRWYAHAVSHIRVGRPKGMSHRICDPFNLGHGVVPTVFWGNKVCQGRDEILIRDISQGLEPDG